jgi:hypothetical protein
MPLNSPNIWLSKKKEISDLTQKGTKNNDFPNSQISPNQFTPGLPDDLFSNKKFQFG